MAALSDPSIGAAEVNRRIGRSSAALMAAHASTYAGRFIKVIIIAAFFGTGVELESYQAAINLPLVINGCLFGALVTAVVPLIVEIRTRRGEREAACLWTRFGLGMMALVVAICLALGIAAHSVSDWITDPARHDAALAAHLLQLLLGYLALYFLVQYLTMIFHGHHQFALPMLTALPNLAVNIVVIIVWLRFIRVEVASLVWGLYAGALVQLVILLVAGWRLGILRPAWGPTPEIGRATHNSLVLLLGSLVSPATLVTVDIIMAAPVHRGIATINYAYAIFMFPVTVGVLNLGYVLLPYLAGQVTERDWAGLARTTSLSMRMLFYVTVPIAVGLWLVSEDVVRVVLERGEFMPSDTVMVAATLRAYMLGLLFAGLLVVVTKIYNAMQRVWVLFNISALAFAVKIAANALLRGPLGAPGIALATGLFYLLSFVLLALWLRRSVPLARDAARDRTVALTLIGGALMFAAVTWTRAAMMRAGWSLTAILLAEMALGAAVWIGWSLAARMPELGMIWRIVVRRGSASVSTVGTTDL
ncbi:polysaccharide biosynthesis C-terminal domain-containing protein [Candidatus Sumerlaeota bacterium]|nr:polysaccharide biosynthesis C-terminal domain-containing protein [Candidatus Sumerlaeota bacterium]